MPHLNKVRASILVISLIFFVVIPVVPSHNAIPVATSDEIISSNYSQFVVTLITYKDNYYMGESVNITITVTNTGSPKTLTFYSSCLADFDVSSEHGTTVYHYLEQHMCLMVITYLPLEINETKVLLNAHWYFCDTNGNPVPPGRYFIHGWMVWGYDSGTEIYGDTRAIDLHGNFDTRTGAGPSIAGTCNGTITPSSSITISKLSTYPCPGTGGHTEYAAFSYSNGTILAEAHWNDYTGDWHNLTFNKTFTLYANETYNYTIRTGSYPQIIHTQSHNATGGVITCTEFVDVNGKRHENWIPAIRLA